MQIPPRQVLESWKRRSLKARYLTVFTILAQWNHVPAMLDHDGAIQSNLTTSALLIALHDSRSDIMSLLLAVSHDKTFPIKDAITVGSPCNFDAFLWNGWDIDQQVEMDGPPALGYAVRDKSLVTWFLANGANPNAGSNYDNALSRAALLGESEVVESLLSHGANVDQGQVLHWAVERQHDAGGVVKLLMDRGAPLHRLEYDGSVPMWSVLGLRSRGLGSPLHNAIAQGKVDVASTLLDGGADPDFVDTKGKTCRDLARESSKTAAFALLGL